MRSMTALKVLIVCLSSTRYSNSFSFGRQHVLLRSNHHYQHHPPASTAFSDPSSYKKRRGRTTIALSSFEDAEYIKINRQKRIVHQYRAMTILYMVFAVFHTLYKKTYESSSSSLMAGGISWILSKAAERDKLSTDTHKRLNKVLGLYGIITALVPTNVFSTLLLGSFTWMVTYLQAMYLSRAFPNEKPVIPTMKTILRVFLGILVCSTRIRNARTVLLAMFTTLQCYQGYEIGVKGWVLKDKTIFLIKNDLKDSWNQIQRMREKKEWISNNFQSLYYAITTLVLASLFLLRLVFGDSATTTALAKLWLMIGASLTLKVGADRGSLMGTTYILLNGLLSYAFGTKMLSSSQSVWSGCSAIFCSLFGAMGFAFQKKKERYHDKLLDSGAYRLSDDFPLQE